MDLFHRRLSVNLNKIALLRNSRRTGVPDLLCFARLAREAGADGITVHPRPDERHVRRSDVLALASLMQPWRPSFELNLEGYPDERLLDIAHAVKPEQCTLVPDSPDAFTSEKGWRLDGQNIAMVTARISVLRQMGCRVILFVDPDPAYVALVPSVRADGIEIYTGDYAASARNRDPLRSLTACVDAAQCALSLGLRVNIGHDLNLSNLKSLAAALPDFAEASIGHELTAHALEIGFKGAVMAYKAALVRARCGSR